MTLDFAGNNSHSTPVVLNHVYTLTRVVLIAGVTITEIELRNPWGVDGESCTSGNAFDVHVILNPDQLRGLRKISRINWGVSDLNASYGRNRGSD
jgi:hypothetical protein